MCSDTTNYILARTEFLQSDRCHIQAVALITIDNVIIFYVFVLSFGLVASTNRCVCLLCVCVFVCVCDIGWDAAFDGVCGVVEAGGGGNGCVCCVDE